MNNQSGIYEIINTVNGKRYIGSTSSFTLRWKQHRRDLRRGAHANPRLQNAWNKSGEVAFEFHPLVVCSVAMLAYYEQRTIDGYCAEYNIAPTAGSMLGFKHSAAFRAKRAEYMTGRKASDAHRAAISEGQKGRVLSAEHVEKLRATRTGKTASEATRAKMSASANAHWAVTPIEQRKRPPLSDAHRKAISEVSKGRPWSDKRRAAPKHIQTESERVNRAAALRAYWQRVRSGEVTRP